MEEYTLYFKMPKWLFLFLVIGYPIMFILVVSDTIILAIPFFEDINDLDISEILSVCLSILFNICFFIFALYVIVAIQLKNKYYYIINKNGIHNNQINMIKKFIPWENELYYCITGSFIGLYTAKMLPLEGDIINEKGIKRGYISIKSKKALKKHHDNKGWIVMSTKLLKGDILIDDIINMINNSRKINQTP